MEKKSSQIIRENITYMINNDETTSMRNLSTSIGASDSFIQKILTEKANPSLEKIDLISEYFDFEKITMTCFPSCKCCKNYQLLPCRW